MSDIATGPRPAPGTEWMLVPHPAFPTSAVRRIIVSARRRTHGLLLLSYRVVGTIDAVCWPGDRSGNVSPDVSEDRRGDDLWRHSCFEAFGMVTGDSGYFELNLSTSGRWAAYAFHDRRTAMRRADDIRLHTAHWRVRAREAEMHAMVEVPVPYSEQDWRLGFSTVIEMQDGSRSYWALAHTPGPPDFHDPACFIATLPAPAAP